nr:MAG TPA: hypothetical protein [Caudoviricetes sp.]
MILIIAKLSISFINKLITYYIEHLFLSILKMVIYGIIIY